MSDTELERLARRRAGAKLGFYIHATVYVLVNVMLTSLSLLAGLHWHVFPALGWGIGLAVHGAVVFLATSGAFDQLVQRERAQLAAQKEPW